MKKKIKKASNYAWLRKTKGVVSSQVTQSATTGTGTVKYYAQIHLQFWQNSVCTGQGNLPLIT